MKFKVIMRDILHFAKNIEFREIRFIWNFVSRKLFKV